jgi:hypothetical protein
MLLQINPLVPELNARYDGGYTRRPLNGIRHFGHYTAWQVYTTLDAKELSLIDCCKKYPMQMKLFLAEHSNSDVRLACLFCDVQFSSCVACES